MMNGVGYSELLLIVIVFLLFFGSKELPRMLREVGKIVGKARRYTDTVRQELDAIARADEPPPSYMNPGVEQKKKLRPSFLAARKAVQGAEREEKTAAITSHLLALPKVRDAHSVMIYLSIGSEVRTDGIIAALAQQGTRIVVPYCKVGSRDLGLASITDIAAQTAKGEYGIREPVQAARDNFFKSDLQAVVVPGLSFDMHGGRLGRGLGYYDNFLRELRGRVPIVGIAFDCQISKEQFPFSYSDVPVDQVVTERGVVIAGKEGLEPPPEGEPVPRPDPPA